MCLIQVGKMGLVSGSRSLHEVLKHLWRGSKTLSLDRNRSIDTDLSLPDEYAFMGALIIQEVIKELVGKGLGTAKVLLLAGSR